MPKPHSITALPPFLAPCILSSLKASDDQHNSLTLIACTLSASPLWLLLRYLGVGLQGAREADEGHSQNVSGGRVVGVVLASFVREWECWRDGARRMVSYRRYHLVLERQSKGCDTWFAELQIKEIMDYSYTTAPVCYHMRYLIKELILHGGLPQQYASMLDVLCIRCSYALPIFPSSSFSLSNTRGRASISPTHRI